MVAFRYGSLPRVALGPVQKPLSYSLDRFHPTVWTDLVLQADRGGQPAGGLLPFLVAFVAV